MKGAPDVVQQVKFGVGSGWTGRPENSPFMNVLQMVVGQAPPKPPPWPLTEGSPPRDSPPTFPSCSLVNIPTASEYCGIAPRKNADWKSSVVPVLPMVGRDVLSSPFGTAVPQNPPCRVGGPAHGALQLVSNDSA